jgi:hypothetical protein
MRAEAEGEDGRAVMELFVGSRTSPALAVEVRAAIDRAIEYATAQMQLVLGHSPVAQLLPVALVAELAAAAFLGIEVLAQNGRQIDIERLSAMLVTAIQFTAMQVPATQLPATQLPGGSPVPAPEG